MKMVSQTIRDDISDQGNGYKKYRSLEVLLSLLRISGKIDHGSFIVRKLFTTL